MEAFAKACPRCGAKYDAVAVFCQKDGAPLRLLEEDYDPRIGQILLDQFRIEQRIGAGGMGIVYRARQTTLGRDVAIKILQPDLAQNPDAVRRFHREARISTAIDHPNVVRVFLFGQLPDGSLYLVMELLRGKPLADVLRVEPRLPVSRALHIAVQVAEGVGEAHAQGVVHRDVKPENVFLVAKGRDPDFVKVLDFGIARLLRADEQTQATQSGLVFGTARYISPEGAAGEATDARSDVYSIGVLTYQMLCGETPFDAASPVTLLMQHVHERPPHLKSRPGGAEVPDGIADVVMRALSKSPSGRFEDGAHFAEVLREAADRAGLPLRSRRATGEVAREPSQKVPLAEPRQALVTPQASTTEPEPPSTEELVVAGLRRRPASRRAGLRSSAGAAAFLLMAFVAGVAAVAGTFWAMERFGGPSAEHVRAERVRAAEEALLADRLDGDGPDTVLAITAQMMAERPQDPDALRLRRAAARRLAERAQDAARAGRRDEALALQRRVLVLLPGDEEARRALLDLERPPEPRAATLTVAPPPVAGASVVLTAVLPPERTLALTDRPRFVVVRDGRRVGRPIDATAGAEPHSWVGSFAFPQPGRYEVQFHGGQEGETLRASTQVEVARAPRSTSSGGDPPVTTQGSLGPSTGPVPSVVELPVPGLGTVSIPPPFVAPPAPSEPAVTASAPPPILPLAPREPPPLPPAWTSTLAEP